MQDTLLREQAENRSDCKNQADGDSHESSRFHHPFSFKTVGTYSTLQV